jgi:hydroxymethylglutaryl-CoA reductase
MKGSDISGFHKMSVEERLSHLKEFSGLTEEEAQTLVDTGSLDIKTADSMIENVAGAFHLPLGIATNFRINGKDYLIPMAIEEPSVVAAASYSAKLTRPGGFKTSSDPPVMIGQIQIVKVPDMEKAKRNILGIKKDIINICNKKDSVLVKFGGGARDIELRETSTKSGKMLILHLLVDVRDAMGANAVNTMAETLTSTLEKASGGKVRLRIISNLADRRLARSRTVWTKEALEESTKGKMRGEEVVEAILQAYHFAESDQYRCTTHNKGIMNGIDAVTIATGNDFRAVESGAHSYAARKGGYQSLTKYEKDSEGNLVGSIELPLAVATIGGATRTNPISKISLKILGVKTAQELAEVIASVGLAQNFAAIRALATEGIQSGHMRLHAKNIAVTAGATGDDIERISAKIIEENNITVSRAKELLGG